MKLFQNTCDFNYPWEQVTAANWRKYPNEVSTHVVAVDVLRRELDASNTILTTERLIKCQQSVPSWVAYIVGRGACESFIREVSVADLNTKTLTLRSLNLTYANILRVYETVTYSPHSLDSCKTVFKQEAQITAHAAIQRLCNKIEDWTADRFNQNAIKGKLGFDGVLKLLNEHWEGLKESELIKQVDTSLDRVKQELVLEAEKLKLETDKLKQELLEETERLKQELSLETGKILGEAEVVSKSFLNKCYDTIKWAFSGGN